MNAPLPIPRHMAMPQPALMDAADTADVITLLIGASDPQGRSRAPASKLFKANGEKQSRTASYYCGIQVHVPDAQAIAKLLKLVGENPVAALCNSRFPGLPVYSIETANLDMPAQQTFMVWAKNEMKEAFGAEHGLHKMPDGRFVVARTKENTLPTSWLMLDRDIKSTAPEWAKNGNWLDLLEEFIPGLSGAPRVETRSSSSRVYRNNTPLGVGHGHVWVNIDPPTAKDVEKARRSVHACMTVAGRCWTEPNKNGKPQTILPIDLATWSACRMAYAGKPQVTADSGLTVGEIELSIVNDGQPRYSLRDIPTTTPMAYEEAKRKLHPGAEIQVDKNLNVMIHDLNRETIVELSDGSMATLGDVEENLQCRMTSGEPSPKQRMQTPLRHDSVSMAAFAGLTSSGTLFVHDSGLPDETHFLACASGDFDVIPDDGEMVEPAIATAPKDGRLRLLTADDLARMPAMRWRIKGVLPERGVASVYGPSGSGKSFLIISMSASIAAGAADWHGYKCKKAPVVYVALEGEAGLSQRISAYRKHHEATCENMHFVTSSLSLLKGSDVDALINIIRTSVGDGAVVCIDTLAQATPGGDENSSVDMGLAIAACKKIQSQLNGLVVLVHHTGKQAAQGPRGHSSLFAALDAAIEVKKDGDARVWSVAKSKDGADGRRHAFKLHTVNLDVDEDLDVVSSCVVIPAASITAKPPSVTPSSQTALEALVKACGGLAAVPCPGGAGICEDHWRGLVHAQNPENKKDSNDKAFRRARDELKKAHMIGEGNGIYWPTPSTIRQPEEVNA